MNINGKREERLLNICLSLKAKTYLSPPNSKSYLDQSDIFNKNNIVLEYFNYSHPTYPQLIKEFQPYISVIDLILIVEEAVKIISSQKSLTNILC